MKWGILSLLSLAAVALAGCEKEAVTADVSPQQSCESNLLSYDEALEIAENAVSLLGDDATRTARRTVDRNNVRAVSASGTRSAESGTDTLIYVFNYADDAGFALVAKDKRATSLLAVTERGSYDGETTDNEGFELYMDYLRDHLAAATSAPSGLLSSGLGDAVITETKAISIRDTTAVGPYLTVAWGQEFPFNYFCFVGGGSGGQQGVAGCDAIAIAQLMSYYEYPTSTQLTYSFAPVSTLALNWSEWKYSADWDVYAVAMFIREIGERNKSEYYVEHTDDGDSYYTKSNFQDDISCLRSFGYTTDGACNYSKGTVFASLNNRRLVMMRGTNASTDKGHAWVIDGYRVLEHTSMHYQRPMGQLDWTLMATVYDRKSYLHFNWGFFGQYDGFYFIEGYSTGGVGGTWTESADVFYPPKADYDYNDDVRIIPNIYH